MIATLQKVPILEAKLKQAKYAASLTFKRYILAAAKARRPYREGSH